MARRGAWRWVASHPRRSVGLVVATVPLACQCAYALAGTGGGEIGGAALFLLSVGPLALTF